MHGGDIYRNEVELDFSVNVNPYGMPKSMEEDICEGVKSLGQYPDMTCEQLRKTLANYHNIRMENIVCGNGASELILAICNGLKPELTLLVAPGFSGYETALNAGDYPLVKWELSKANNYELTIDVVKAIMENEPDLIFITNPNNPTGKLVDGEVLEKIVHQAYIHNAMVVIDECFIEMTTKGDSNSFIGRLNLYNNVIVLRAFTKSFAIPGLRLGYVVSCSDSALTLIKKNLPEWNVSLLAQIAGVSALNNMGHLTMCVKLIHQEKYQLEMGLKKLGLIVYESDANYVMFECKKDVDLYTYLLERKILIRRCGDYTGLTDRFYRVAVKKREDNEKLIKCLEGIVG